MDRTYIDFIKSIIKNNSQASDFDDFHSIYFANNVISDFNNILSVLKVNISDEDKNHYINLSLHEFLHENPITVKPPKSLVKSKSNWLTKERQIKAGWIDNENPLSSYRTRYLEYLRKLGRVDKVIEDVSSSSISILEKIADPLVNHNFQKKGLVVGSVQSGKTGNFNAVINSSIDLGYRLIIVLSGGMEDLRKQTQERIEKEVEGREVRQNEWNGVGNIIKFGARFQNNIEQIIMPTSIEKDFNLGLTAADFALDKINVLVCKKNTAILRNILVWLKRFATKEVIDNIPLLIIDDEADNASLNNLGHKGKEEATRINLQIRCILNLFSKSSYIGYTATPFANILQDRNETPDNPYEVKTKTDEYKFYPIGNLFPEDFIELLNPPSNYIGPKNFFETKISTTKKIHSLIEVVYDWNEQFPYRVRKDNPNIPYLNNLENLTSILGTEKDAKKQLREESRAAAKSDIFPKTLPESLKDSVKCFIISCAVRLKRKPSMIGSLLYQRHNSMLIHISRYTLWQDRTTTLLKDYFQVLKHDLNNNPINSDVYNDFRRIWNKYYIETIENGTLKELLPDDYEDSFMQKANFDEILNYLISAINGIEIVCANSNSNFTLDYSGEPKQYIVVGGNRLSRGFTLEGLSINYFVRDTNYADSLLQMGRWFGYRPGYLDCCKLFTTSDTIESFDFTTCVIEDIEAQFGEMSSKDKAPSDFAIKVMNDPDVIKITRPSILKNATKIRWSYSDKLDQTTKFSLDKNKIESAWDSFLNFFKTKSLSDYKGSIKYYNTDANGVCDVLQLQNTFLNPKHFEPLIRFIKDVQINGALTNWSIAIRTKGQGKVIAEAEQQIGFQITPSIRRIKENNYQRINEVINNGIYTASGNSSNIVTAGSDFAFAISDESKNKAEEFFRKQNNNNKNYPEKIYRNSLSKKNGVLIIYPIDLESLTENQEIKDFFVKKGINKEIPLLGYAVGIPNLGDNFEKEYFVQQGFLDEHGNLLDSNISEEFEEIEEQIYEDEFNEFTNNE